MIERFKNISALKLIFSAARGLVALFLIKGGAELAADRICRGNGSLAQRVYARQDFEMSGITLTEEGYVAADNDPQMIIQADTKINTVKFYAEYSLQPGEIVMYYTTSPEGDFSERKRVWFAPVPGQDGWYEADMNIKNVCRLRLDPTIYAGNIMNLGDIVINEERSAGEFFNISYSHFYILIVYTGIISSFLRIVQELFTKNSHRVYEN